jgi:hypothetical protein
MHSTVRAQPALENTKRRFDIAYVTTAVRPIHSLGLARRASARWCVRPAPGRPRQRGRA